METKYYPFIVMTGPVGGGKTTQIKRLETDLAKRYPDVPVLSTKANRNGDAYCAGVHKALAEARREDRIVPIAELFGQLSICAEHIERVLLPALAEGKLVIQNRHIYDTYAHLCAARHAIHQSEFRYFADRAMHGVRIPDIVFFLDVDPEVGLTRKVKSGETKKVEKGDLDLHVDVRRGYEDFFRLWPEHKVIRIDSTRQSEEKTFREVRKVVADYLRERLDLKPRR